jgi:hypothetical protein
MMRNTLLRLALIFIIVFLYAPLHASSQRYLSQTTRYPFEINDIRAQIPCATNLRLDQKHPEVTRMVLAIHSSSYNPDYYLENTLLLFQNSPKELKKTLIVAPAFYRKDKTDLSNIVVWKRSPFWGSSKGLYRSKKVEVSAYEILDHLLKDVMTSDRFPHLKEVIVLGHSAGGQLVNRYAACNTVEDTIADKHNISMRYLVMAPSTYVYMDGRRMRKQGEQITFDYPFNAVKKYDNWGYGLKHLYRYHKRHHINADTIRWQYQYRRVLYLVGDQDTGKHHLSQTRSAMYQGANRLERLKIYYHYLETYYGRDIHDYHAMAIVKGAGHSSRQLMLSEEGRRFILE